MGCLTQVRSVYTEMEPQIHDITKMFVAFSPDKNATLIEDNKAFYKRLEQTSDGFIGYEVFAGHDFDRDWGIWEMHPNGDEIVVLLSGEATLVMHGDGKTESVLLKEVGSYVIVPKGVWHTAYIAKGAKMLFITPGEGSQFRENVE